MVHVIYRRKKENRLRNGDVSMRFLAAGGKHPAAVVSAPPSGRSGGLALRATSTPPPSISIFSNTCWGSRELRLDGVDDWEEVAATVGDEAVGADGAAIDAIEGEYGVGLEYPPTGGEVRAAIASIEQLFENPSGVFNDALMLQEFASPSFGLPLSGIFMDYFSVDSLASEKQVVGLANLEYFPSDIVTRQHKNVLDAFRLMQEDPSVQKMVMSLSTDKDVWDAVMNNDAVQEFKKSVNDAKKTDLNGRSSTPPGMMKWILGNTQAKIKELLEKILNLVSTLFQAKSEDYDFSDNVVRMSFMLSVFIYIVVTVARIK